MTEIPGHLRPFVVPVPDVAPERSGPIDLYIPGGDGLFPAVVIMHGGPLPPDSLPTPRDWPVFHGYGSLLTSLGLVAAVVDHRFHVLVQPDGAVIDYQTAAGDVADAVDAVRNDSRVDAERVVVWFFSGGGLLSADWLRLRAPWLRGVALTYPMLAPLPGWPSDPRFQPIDAVAAWTGAPILLTRVGQERPEIAETVAGFLAATADAGVPVEIVDVPGGHHSFDTLDDTNESRSAIIDMTDRVRLLLT
jgi:acetyl esterase/lipase